MPSLQKSGISALLRWNHEPQARNCIRAACVKGLCTMWQTTVPACTMLWQQSSMAARRWQVVRNSSASTWLWKKKLSSIMKKTLLHGELSQSCISWVTYCPKGAWNYRDETVAFQFQQLFYKRGGYPKPGHQTEKALLKWAAEEKFFSLKEQPA